VASHSDRVCRRSAYAIPSGKLLMMLSRVQFFYNGAALLAGTTPDRFSLSGLLQLQ
jgi:hypothetical protein